MSPQELASPSPAERLDELDALFAALAHRARRQILLVLRFRGGSMSAGDIARRFEHAWPTTTRHLGVLEAAKLITQERQGRARMYRLNGRKLQVIDEWLAWFESPFEDEQATATAIPEAESVLREFALGYPESKEDFPWGGRVIKVQKKVFVSMGSNNDGFSISIRLPDSRTFALTRPFVQPTASGLAPQGWVTASFAPDEEPPLDLLRGWIDESYRAIAPKRLVAQLVRSAKLAEATAQSKK